MIVSPSATLEATCSGFDSGLTGTIGVRIIDNAGATTTARATAGITEYPAGSGFYQVTMTAPSTTGDYTLMWDTGTVTPETTAYEDLTVSAAAAAALTGSGNLYITLAELKATLSITSSTWDDDLTAAITAASRAVDEDTGRRFYLDADATSVRYYDPSTTSLVLIDDLAALTSVAVDPGGTGTFSTAWTAGTNFNLDPYNAAADGWPYEALKLRVTSSMPTYERSIKVTGQFGWPAVPAPISEATTLLASRLFKRAREAPLGVFGLGVDGTTVRISRTDPDVAAMIAPYNRGRMMI